MNENFTKCQHGVYGLQPDACGICLTADRDRAKDLLYRSWFKPATRERGLETEVWSYFDVVPRRTPPTGENHG